MEFHKSPEELQALRRELIQGQLPNRCGPKDSVPDESEEQAERIEQQLEQFERSLSEERILRKGNISVGKWNAEKKVAEIEVGKGVHWSVFGKVIGGQLVLLPEEALYMVDHGMLELFYNDLPMSVQQAYDLVLSDAFPLHHYVVYSHLRNLGFIVLRHERRVPKSVFEIPDMEEIGEKMDENIGTMEEKMKQTEDEERKENMKEVINDNLEEVTEENTDEEFYKNNDDKLEENIDEEVEKENDDKMGEEKDMEKERGEQMEENNEGNEKIVKEKLDETMKQSVGKVKDRDSEPIMSTAHNPVSHYWEDGQCQPLVRPSDSTSVDNILNKLQIIENETAQDASPLMEEDSCTFGITFDVFQPQKHFKKSDPGLPNHSICVCKFSEPPPSIGEMNFLARKSYPVSLKYAVVDGRDIVFYSMLDVQLPTYIEC